MKHKQTLRRGLGILLCLVLCLSLLPTTVLAEGMVLGVAINESTFPDATFRGYVSTNFDKDSNGILSPEECEAATEIDCSSQGIKTLNGIGYFNQLTYLDCSNNQLAALNVSNNKNMTHLNCSGNQLTSLVVSSNQALRYLDCGGNSLTTLDVSSNTALTTLYCYSNQLTSLDLSQNTNLTYLSCGSNQLTSLDLSSITAALENFTLWCSDNSYEIELTDRTFNLSTLPNGFNVSKASDWSGGTVSGNTLTVTDSTVYKVTYTYDCGKDKTCTFTLRLKGVIIPVVAKIDEENFPDKAFRTVVKSKDLNKDDVLNIEEIQNVKSLSCGGKDIACLKGIEYFTELTWLDCERNQLTALDVSKNTKLEILYCSGNSLTSLDLSNNEALTYFDCDS